METAHRLLRASAVSDGYTALWERGRLDLTVEALVLEPAWHNLFTDADRAIAARRLAEYGYTAAPSYASLGAEPQTRGACSPASRGVVPTVDDMLQFAGEIEGQQVTTLAGRASFRVNALPTGIEIIPDSTGRSRVIPRDRIAQVLAEFSASGSMRTTHYQSITFDSSYLLTLLQRFLDQASKSE